MGADDAVPPREHRRRDAGEVGDALRSVLPSALDQARQRPEVAAVIRQRRGLALPELISDRSSPARPNGRYISHWDANDGLQLYAYVGEGDCWIDVPTIGVYGFNSVGPVTVASPHDPQVTHDVWLRSVLPLVVQSRGTEVLHASAVRRDDSRIVAFCGKATAGKSTLAAALRQSRSLEIVADDALAFTVDESVAYGHPLPHRLRLRTASAQHLHLPALSEGPMSLEAAPIASVVILEPQDGEDIRLDRLLPGPALGALMPHAYCFDFEKSKARLAAAYINLCQVTPVYRLAYGQKLPGLDDLLKALDRTVR